MILQYIQSKSRQALSIALIVFILANLPAAALPATGDTIRVSVDSSGVQGNNHSFSYATSSISSDGRYVTFQSLANNLVHGDTNDAADVFVHDRTTGVTTRVSVDSNGKQGNDSSGYPSISSDGRYVAFASIANNLVTGDKNGEPDIFVHDCATGVTSLVSIDSNGMQANSDSANPSISSDGRYVAFQSSASNLVVGDTNGVQDIFVHDIKTGSTTRVSVNSAGVQGNCYSLLPYISSDGSFVAFESSASNLVSGDTNGTEDIFVFSLLSGITTRISVNSDGIQANAFSWDYPSISSNGRYVAFGSDASNLVDGDTNGTGDIFIHDLLTGNTARISVDSNGVQGNNNSYNPSISPDGNFVSFGSNATNLVTGDTNNMSDIFVRDLANRQTIRVSVNSGGEQANQDSFFASISSDGHFVAFDSAASNLVMADTNNSMDVFVHEPDYSRPPTPTAAHLPTVPASIPSTGFAPLRIAPLSFQSWDKAYMSQNDLWMEIPRLGVQMNILGVPKVNGSWDVSWLGKNAGWLNGSAFPTWSGNSVLTGHVYDAYGQPGPFRYINTLWYGDKIIIHYGGVTYMYEVREVMQVMPEDVNAMMKHEEFSWITLVTCRGYDEIYNTYKYRVLVRAVIVGIN